MSVIDRRKSKSPSIHNPKIHAISTFLTQPRFERHNIQRMQGDPSALQPADLMLLQRAVGNQAVLRLQSSPQGSTTGGASQATPAIQRKLHVGAANDHYEQEADRVARQVVSAPSPTPARAEVQPKGMVQRQAQGSFAASDGFEHRLKQTKGRGQPLPNKTRTELEPAFGADFSGVRIHNHTDAKVLNRDIQAKAFTHGNDIHFAEGAYNPHSTQGKRLLAHELTHTIQQSGGQQLRRQKNGIQRKATVTPAPDTTIQRTLSITSSELASSVSLTSRFASFFGQSSDSIFDELKETLIKYEQATTANGKFSALKMLKYFTRQWLGINSGEVAQGSAKSIIIGRLLGEVLAELPTATSETEDEDYVDQIGGKKLKYMSQEGEGIASNVKDWHKGTDTSTRGTNATKLIKDYGLSLGEATAIGVYTADDYKYMNPAAAKNRGWMRAKLPDVNYTHTSTRSDISGGVTDKHIDEATTEGDLHGTYAKKGMAKLPDWNGDTYRGLALTPTEFATQYPLNGISTFPAFSSTSLVEHVSRGFAKREAKGGKIAILLRLHLTKGKDIRPLSAFPNEAEILLMPGATFTISSITDDTDGTKLVDLTQTS